MASDSDTMIAVDERTRTTSVGSDSGPDRTLHRQTSTGEVSFGRRRTLSQPGMQGRAVVLAIDDSENAKVAFDWYINELRKPTDFMVLLHCPEPPRLPMLSFKSGMALPVDEWKTILDEMNAKTRKLEEDYEGTCIQRKLRYKVRGEAMKNPGEGIIKIAEEEKAEMIVMGTRGMGAIKRALMGSVSDYVVRNATMPIVVVPGRKIQKRRQSQAAMEQLSSSPA